CAPFATQNYDLVLHDALPIYPTDKPLEGYRQMTPMVYAGLYPTDNAKFNDLRDALEKLQLNDAALTFEPESSQALGFGFRCGFRSEEHTSELQSRFDLVCRLL